MHIHIYQIYGKCAGCINYAHCTHIYAHMLNDTAGKMFVRVHRACAAAVKHFSPLSPNRAKDGKHFQPSAEEEGGTRKHGFRGKFSDDEEKGGCLEFWSTCFLND